MDSKGDAVRRRVRSNAREQQRQFGAAPGAEQTNQAGRAQLAQHANHPSSGNPAVRTRRDLQGGERGFHALRRTQSEH